MKSVPTDRMMVVVAYDVADMRRRGMIRRILLRVGTPVQESVFECFTTESELESITDTIRQTLVAGEDDIRYYILCRACRARAYKTNGEEHAPQRVVIV
jgi:CRISPR-associated protein Cas2